MAQILTLRPARGDSDNALGESDRRFLALLRVAARRSFMLS